jgi:hypothetical protein
MAKHGLFHLTELCRCCDNIEDIKLFACMALDIEDIEFDKRIEKLVNCFALFNNDPKNLYSIFVDVWYPCLWTLSEKETAECWVLAEYLLFVDTPLVEHAAQRRILPYKTRVINASESSFHRELGLCEGGFVIAGRNLYLSDRQTRLVESYVLRFEEAVFRSTGMGVSGVLTDFIAGRYAPVHLCTALLLCAQWGHLDLLQQPGCHSQICKNIEEIMDAAITHDHKEIVAWLASLCLERKSRMMPPSG